MTYFKRRSAPSKLRNARDSFRGFQAIWLALALGALAVSPAVAQHCTDSAVPGTLIGFTPLPGTIEKPNSCNLLPCYEPEEDGGAYVQVDENCNANAGSCPVQVRVPLKFPGNSQMPSNGHVRVYWFDQPTPEEDGCLPPPLGNCSPISLCGPPGAEILVDRGETFIQIGASCAAIAAGQVQGGSFSLSAYSCQTLFSSCTERLDVSGIEVPLPEEMWDLLGCDPPPPPCDCSCNVGGGGSGGGGSAGGGPPPISPARSGPGALLRHRAKGAGHPDHPGAADWQTTLGRYWSHDYAERIVPDPDDNHVWLITRDASFLEFSALQDGVYQDVSPSDEYRKLSRTDSGWELRDFNGTVQTFDDSGLWEKTVDRNGNAVVAGYVDEELRSVSFSDGRSETFSYHRDGKLAAITEVGVAGEMTRTWFYTWEGLDLVTIDRPDGTAWSFHYEDARHPGYMTRMILVGTDGSERIESAVEYDHRGNVLKSWKGAESFTSPAAVNGYSFSYDNPFRPTVTEVTDPLNVVTSYEIDRDPGGIKPRIRETSGACSTCGVGPNTQEFYDDPANPMRVTRSVDARGTVTLFEYDANGQMTSRTEAFMTELERTTTWKYENPRHPALVTAVEVPSTSGMGVKRTSWIYDDFGNATSKTEEGIENGEAFRYTTEMKYNEAGMLEWIDPPGDGEEDRTTFTYDSARGNRVLATRADPLIGTTIFGVDDLNRLTWEADPRGLITETAYDIMDRVKMVTMKGDLAEENIVTKYTYTPHKELFQTILPESNIIEHGYDESNRLRSIEWKTKANTPGERIYYTLNEANQMTEKEFQIWDGTEWKTEHREYFDYSNICQLDQAVHADGSVTELEYDCNGNVQHEWDANHPSNGKQNQPTKSYSYDVLNRPRTTSQPWGGERGGIATVEHKYDIQDHPIEVIDANGNSISYTYSDRGLLTREISDISGEVFYFYNSHGQLIKRVDAKKTTTEWHLSVAGLYDLTFARDAMGNMELVTYSNSSNTRERHFTYQDYQYFMTTADGPWGHFEWDYDHAGNRIEETQGDTIRTYHYENNSRDLNSLKVERITSDSGPVDDDFFDFDQTGNMISRANAAEKVKYIFNSDGTLDQIKQDGVEISTETQLTYDGRGLLLASNRLLPSSGDPFVRRSASFTYDSNGVLHRVSTKHQLSPESSRDRQESSDRYVFYIDNRPIAFLNRRDLAESEDSPQQLEYILRFVTTDHLGTPIITLGEDKSITWESSFDPFGFDKSDAFDEEVFVRFPGHLVDRSWADEGSTEYASLHYNVHRWYAPDLGRYLSVDPRGSGGGSTNLYVYGLSNPLRFFDPLGLAVTTRGCGSQGHQIYDAIQTAFEKVKNRRPDCVQCVSNQDLDNRLNNLRVRCAPNATAAKLNCADACGCASDEPLFSNTIWLFSNSFAGLCGCLEGVILHEVLHTLGKDHDVEPDSSGNNTRILDEYDCFDCVRPSASQAIKDKLRQRRWKWRQKAKHI